MSTTPEDWRPCFACGELTLNEKHCRDCNIERSFAEGSCRECFTWIVRVDVAGPKDAQHKAGCSLAASEDYTARTEAELQRVMAGR